MDEIYTCTCRSQTWIIMDSKICCNDCGKEYGLIVFSGRGLESPKDFNERIKKEA